MPRVSCVMFGAKHLSPESVAGRRVLDVGASDFNGSMRPLLEHWGCSEYVGVDMEPGPGVDIVMNADDMVEKLGADSFDIVLCLEMMEHTRYWRRSLHNIKGVCRPGGLIVMTAPAPGYGYHGYPTDFWRYEPADFATLFNDFVDVRVEFDSQGPGAFVAARKPLTFSEADLSAHKLYSVVTGFRQIDLDETDFNSAHFRRTVFKVRLREGSLRLFLSLGRFVTKLLRLGRRS